MQNFLFRKIDNAPLIVFRILFGLLMLWQSVKFLTSGWIERILLKPKYTFPFIATEWLQPLPGNGMYYYIALMGLLSLFIAIGFRYRFSLFCFGVLWAGTYFMQKTSYNNHYYLIILMCFIMLFLPANTYASVDSRLNPAIKKHGMSAWCSHVIVFQVAIVYFFAAAAKLYPGWLNGSFAGILFSRPGTHWYSFFIASTWFHLFIAYSGLLFDFLIVPVMLYKKTRLIGLAASIFFHFFNSYTLHIGVFPFFSIALLIFFYPPDTIRRLFMWKKPPLVQDEIVTAPKYDLRILKYIFIPYFIIQLVLPIRHHFIKGDVLWTEEGHRLSWRMMLRHKTAKAAFTVIDKNTGKECAYSFKDKLTKSQIRRMAWAPDMIWQMAQYIKKDFAAQGKSVAVYVNAKVSVNKGPKRLLINPKTDLAAAEWNHFTHNEWILLYND